MKVAHFIPVKTTYSEPQLAELYMSRIVYLHGLSKKIMSDRGTEFTWVNGYSFYRYHVSKEWNFAQPELTLAEFCIELMISQSLKHNAKMAHMLFSILGID
jgi:hypothetical protein